MIEPELAQPYYRDHDSAHGFDHVLRVWRLAMRIGEAEGANLEIVQAAALLHDVGRADEEASGVCHAKLGAQRACQILAGHPEQRVEAVAQAIAQHRFRGTNGPQTLEAQVLYDADKLDAIGAIGVARAFAVAGVYGQKLWAPVEASLATRSPAAGRADRASDEHTPVHEFHFKLARLKDSLYTRMGRQLAAERHAFMVAFFERLGREVQGEV